MTDDLLSLDPSDKLSRLIKHSVRLVEKQEEVRKVLREAIARMVEEKLRAQNGGYLRLREYEHMVTFALRKASLDPQNSPGRDPQGVSRKDGDLFNALVEKLLKDVDSRKENAFR